MKRNDGNGQFSSYVFLNDEKDKAFSSNENPDEFIKYGKYEMRIRDKTLIERGYTTQAKVKWWGGIDYQYPYLWKENKTDMEYEESWDDPRKVQTKKEELKKQIVIPKIKKGGGPKM